MRHGGARLSGRRGGFAAADDEAAAYRVELFLLQNPSGGIESSEAHAIRMARQHLVAQIQQVERLIEADLVLTEDIQPARGAYSLHRRLDVVRIHFIGTIALEPRQQGAIGAVTMARQGKRAI